MTKLDFNKAFHSLPKFIGGVDVLYHRTLNDLAALVQHEIDLYEEGEETDIKTAGQLRQAKRYLEQIKESV